jgi:hypothetical protein
MSINPTKPTVGGDAGTWGEELNTVIDTIVDSHNALPFYPVAALDYTGVTDATSDLNTALSAASASSGPVGVSLAPGLISISGTVTVPAGVSLVGAGGSINSGEPVTTIQCSASGAGLVIAGGGGEIKSLTIDGNNVATQPLLRGSSSSAPGAGRTFVGVSVINSASHGWVIEGSQNDVYLGCQSSLNTGRGIVLDYGCGGLLFARFESNLNTAGALLIRQSGTSPSGVYSIPTHVTFLHCVFERIPADAPTVEASSGDQIFLTNCAIAGSSTSGATSPLVKLSSSAHMTLDNAFLSSSTTTQSYIVLSGSSQITIEGRSQCFGSLAADIDVPSGCAAFMVGTLTNTAYTGLVYGSNTTSNGDSTIKNQRFEQVVLKRPAGTDPAFQVSTNSDTGLRYQVLTNGQTGWMDGTSFTLDTFMLRGGVAQLNMNGHFVANADATYDLGTSAHHWRNLYINVVRSPQATQTLAANGAVTINSQSGDAAITLQANATSSSITGSPVNGQKLAVTWIQDSTGGRTYSWPTNCKFAGGSAPSDTTASKRSTVTFRFDGTNWYEESRAVAVG